MKKRSALTAALIVAACSTGHGEAPFVGPLAQAPPATSSIETGPGTMPRRLCYFLDNATLTSGVRLTLDVDAPVVGETYGTIHNDAAGYFAFYRQSHEGVVSGPSMTVTTVTEIDFDRQTTREYWTFGPQQLIRDDLIYPAADCQAVDARFDQVSGG